jgi:glycogen debranching enzyme
LKDGRIQVEQDYYIVASSPPADDRRQVLKHDDTFAVLDRHGDIQSIGLGELGLYHTGTRFLSHCVLGLGRDRPMLLSSTVSHDNAVLTVHLTNPDLHTAGEVLIPRGTLHLVRSIVLWQGACDQQIRVTHYGASPIRFTLMVQFAADFADIFEVRGLTRRRHGHRLRPTVEAERVVLAYEGLDGIVRRTTLTAEPAPRAVTRSSARFDLELQPHAQTELRLTIGCDTSTRPASARRSFRDTLAAARAHLDGLASQGVHVHTSNDQFNAGLRRARVDLAMMTTTTPDGLVPYAGVPWFSTPFGRDAIITASSMLWIDPTIARGALAFLAAHQARETVPEREAEPGKILHEMRLGELAALGEIPFGRYYGSIDATPLFVLLAAQYYERTADEAFIRALWPAIGRAMDWLDTWADPDRDGFIEYARHSPNGLIHQGWKDSHDAIFHEDGTLAEGPIALCEAQAYAYAARCAAAELATMLGNTDRAEALLVRAHELQQQFEETFWCDTLGTYALALDGRKRPCRVRASNAGHCLFTGIASPEHAAQVVDQLMSPAMFSGWGVRTVAEGAARYNPMSYHNGSIWPHDNALIALGCARYGLMGPPVRILTGLFDACQHFDLHRLPELFCGFSRYPGEAPTRYPVACSPQAWSAASVFLLLQACLGLSINAAGRQIRLMQPGLPDFLDELRISNLVVGDATVDLRVQRAAIDLSVTIARREGDVEVVVVR